MFFHRCLQNFVWQFIKCWVDLTQQDNRPFNKPCDLGQKPAILDDLKSQRERLIGRIVPNHIGAFIRAQHNIGTLQLDLIVFKIRDQKRIWT